MANFFESEAERLLAARGAEDNPPPLKQDLTKWLEKMYEAGKHQGLSSSYRIMKDVEWHIANVKRQLDDEAKKAG